jgi:serine/threonine protein kinase
MHLHELGIFHGGITPVGKARGRASLNADAWHAQSNILITQDSQACLGDFGIGRKHVHGMQYDRGSGHLRYMPPEQFGCPVYMCEIKGGPSKEGDVYSLAMTSFEVRSSGMNHPTARYHYPITIRSSQGYYHTMTAMRVIRSTVLQPINDHPAQRTEDGCRTPFGM